MDSSNGTSAGRTSTSPGNVFVSTYNGSASQQWQFEMVSTSTDDHSNTSSGATTITTQAGKSGMINYSGDLDYFKFVPSYTGDYEFYTVRILQIPTASFTKEHSDPFRKQCYSSDEIFISPIR